jgi:uncharacterized repeat protein (TIGR04138 family)
MSDSEAQDSTPDSEVQDSTPDAEAQASVSKTELLQALISFNDELDAASLKLPQYDRRALAFVYSAMGAVSRSQPEGGHITAEQLARGVVEQSKQAFGLMAQLVLEGWGIHSSEDIGEIVYGMCDAQIIQANEGDRKEDFEGLFRVAGEFREEHDWPGVKTLIEKVATARSR